MNSEMRRQPEAIAEAIRAADSIAICSHINPDGDTIGCALAMRLGLLALGKKPSVFCEDKIPDNLAMLPGVETFRNPSDCGEAFDLFLAVDVSDPARLGTGRSLMERCAHTAQIDHHPTNPMTREIAMCLYTGMSTDTGNFSFSATSAEVFSIMSELMRAGLPLSELSRILFRERSREQLRLLGRAIEHLRFAGGGRIAVMTLSRQDFLDCGALNEHADTIVNYGLETVGTQMAVLAREDEPGMIKFSLRSKSPQRIDDVAKSLGGGGHPQASGITLAGTLREATAVVVAALEQKLETEK